MSLAALPWLKNLTLILIILIRFDSFFYHGTINKTENEFAAKADKENDITNELVSSFSRKNTAIKYGISNRFPTIKVYFLPIFPITYFQNGT